MAELSIEQRRAIAMAQARMRLQASGGGAAPSQPKQPPEAQPVQASNADRVIGGAPGRFALGASGVLTGPFQLGANAGAWLNENVVAPVAEKLGATKTAEYARNPRYNVGGMTNRALKDLDASKRRGMAAAGQDPDSFDAAGLAGNVVAAVAGTGKLKPAATLGKKVLQGAKIGGIFGAAAPDASGGDDYWRSKAAQTATGAVVGGAIPAVGAALSRVAKGVRNVADVVVPTKSGLDRLSRNYYERLVGKGNVDSVADDLINVDPLIPGGKPTAAEALTKNALGSPLQAQQNVTARTAGGVSGRFAQRAQNQELARKSAEIARDTVTKPMRDAALARATNIDRRALMLDVSQIGANPQTQAVRPAREFIGKVIDDIDNAKTAEELYAVRKYLDDLINGRIESENNVAKFASTQLIGMKKAIDTAIESGGAGKSWSGYLSEYAKRSRAIDESAKRAAEMYKPAQPTSIPGAAEIAEKTGVHGPNLLSREAMIANWLLRQARMGVEPKLDDRMAEHFLNPQLMGQVMKGPMSSKQRALWEAVKSRASQSAAAGAATAPSYDNKEKR